ncbi:aldehyde reductase [Schumannella luteola]|uniref:Nucleoside-diphosphate-sugar epimerase n=1 Tax=Schumannella luteola TaxID=472059 RepID=A0A852YQA4_9MICO|nr:aldehyde reductase [Schumannella luteola]NYG99909.1 nucleoside-diphosphate-sugar epimerase [Schumannella luteola]TPW90505.1 aldehyde reductase [Schumannella luteola]
MPQRILVTGGSGYIGGWCVLAALRAGYDVRTTVRDLAKGDTLRGLLQKAEAFDGARLQIVRADLASDDGWADAVADVDFVLHVASPTLRTAVESEEAMIAAARDGVRRVLRASRDAGVKRVVLTSASGAIVYGHPKRTEPFTENDWTVVDNPDVAPYQRSKTLAERAAWAFVEQEGGALELAAVNPTAVIGPLLGTDDPPSLRTIRGMLTGALPVCPPFGTGWVDVRDVADLHLRAMTDPAAAGERFIAISGRSLRIVDVARILRARLGDRAAKVPTRELPVFAARLLGVRNPALRALRPQLGRDFPATGAKAERLLGWRPRPIEDSIAETAESLIAHGLDRA